MATATAEASTALVDSLRTRISQAAPDHADLVINTLIEAIQAKKQVSVTCRKCNTPTRAEILDAVAATNAIKLLIEQTEGRPGVAGEQQDSGLTIHRSVYGSSALPGHSEPSAHTDARGDGELEVTEQLWPIPDTPAQQP